MRSTRELIVVSPGFESIEVRLSIAAPDRYLLRFMWSDVAAHRDGFRQSDRHAKWRALLHHFYQPMPSVEYFGASII